MKCPSKPFWTDNVQNELFFWGSVKSPVYCKRTSFIDVMMNLHISSSSPLTSVMSGTVGWEGGVVVWSVDFFCRSVL